MIDLIITSFYFILPAYFANMAPVFGGKLNLPLGMPVSEKHLGAHKTWRGFYTGFLGALFALYLQKYFQSQQLFEAYRVLDYQAMNVFLYAFLFGIGAITGDTIKSFFKRKYGKKSGESWFPFDQLDFIVGSVLFVYLFFLIPWEIVLTIFLITPLLHFLTNVVGYWVGMKKVWW